MKIICKQCHQEFELTDSEIRFYNRKNLSLPKRCKRCREINRKMSYSENGNYYSPDVSDETRIIDYKTIIAVLSVIIVAILIISGALIYALSDSDKPEDSQSGISLVATQTEQITYYLNTYRKKFHKPDCESVQQMNAENRKKFYGTREEAIAQGYSPCNNCNP
ncbi:MAG: zinc-ribbon domain-containing protein [Ruminococcus sp.]|nr:zinc-ribbon domain-containing protein [Ruminococcus sp.]